MDGLPRLGAYTAAKAGRRRPGPGASAELGPEGVTANAVAPGSTRTAMLDASAGVYDSASVEDFVVRRRSDGCIEADEVAAAIASGLSRPMPRR